ncbi:sodium/sugar symporter [Thermophagus sp. OGC60D27]|uniref:sodium/sugar symporter n=1 Tax=Thermophagus sp. OGC60D27 TaxID=3458415 RepID=UPI00403784A1
MNPDFHFIDYFIFALYALLIVGVGLWVSRSKGKEKTAEDYFLASKSLPWWAVGASLIAANISAEQFIGMAGSGFAIGLAIASYEWMAAITLIIVAKYFLPVFVRQGLYTIPEFVEKRYNTNLKTILAIFWICLFIFVNLTSVLFLGGKALDTIMGLGDGTKIIPFMIGLALFSAAYSLWGGLSSVAWTDVIQVVLLVVGGIITTVIALDNVTPTGGAMEGLSTIYNVASEKFHMILSPDNPEYTNLPGIAVLIGGMWVANLYYWGFNQYIIQRAFAAKSLAEAQKGLAFAGFLKIIVPLIVVIPGIIAFTMYSQDMFGAQEAFNTGDAINYDKAYPWLIARFIPVGIKGLVVAALSAAIVSSLASMLNSTATIFTMDIYKPYFNKNAGNKALVTTGRITVLVALLIAISLANFLGSIPQMFQYIQEYTTLVSPGILAIFLLGLFWKKTNAKGAIVGVIVSVPFALLLKVLPIDMPFMDRAMYTLLTTIVVIMGVSLTTAKDDDDPKAIALDQQTFKTNKSFNLSAYAITVILAVLYIVFW